MPEQLIFAMEVTLNGLMTGVMYALVALGFVLIFKASGIFNYAQGVMALFAAMRLQSTTWREPRIEVEIQLMSTGDCPCLTVIETGLES